MPSKKNSRRAVRLESLMGPLEAEVMGILWNEGPSVVSEIEEIINQRRDQPLAYKTILTICTRLSEKGVLTYVKEGRAFRYRPAMTEQEFVKSQASRATNEVLDKFGDLAVAGFVDHVVANPDQLAALSDLLEQKRRNKG